MPADDDTSRGFASPPCFLHELDPTYREYQTVEDAVLRSDVMRWRKAERLRLLGKRQEIPLLERQRRAAEIGDRLNALLGDVAGMVISGYWPMKGEPDLRDWLAHLRERGAQVALPRVVEKGHPLRFLLWEEGARLERGVWNIPHPAEAVETLPDVALAPLVGFDHGRYRLGYGGGYFDRTLASTSPAPRAIGVGYREMEIETIFPLSHDFPMSEIVAV